MFGFGHITIRESQNGCQIAVHLGAKPIGASVIWDQVYLCDQCANDVCGFGFDLFIIERLDQILHLVRVERSEIREYVRKCLWFGRRLSPEICLLFFESRQAVFHGGRVEPVFDRGHDRCDLLLRLGKAALKLFSMLSLVTRQPVHLGSKLLNEHLYHLRDQKVLLEAGKDTLFNNLAFDRARVVARAFGPMSGAAVTVLADNRICVATLAALQESTEQKLPSVRAV